MDPKVRSMNDFAHIIGVNRMLCRDVSRYQNFGSDLSVFLSFPQRIINNTTTTIKINLDKSSFVIFADSRNL